MAFGMNQVDSLGTDGENGQNGFHLKKNGLGCKSGVLMVLYNSNASHQSSNQSILDLMRRIIKEVLLQGILSNRLNARYFDNCSYTTAPISCTQSTAPEY